MKICARTVAGLMTGEDVQPGIKHTTNVNKQDILQNIVREKIGDNPITSHLVFQEPAKFQPSNPTIS